MVIGESCFRNGQVPGRTFDYYGHFEQGFNTFGNGFMKVGAYALLRLRSNFFPDFRYNAYLRARKQTV